MAVDLAATAQRLTAAGKGLLASDESTPTIGKRLQKAGIEDSLENRRDYRQLFYTAPGLGDHISGAILYKETLAQRGSDGVPFVDALNAQGILPGIKVDEVRHISTCIVASSPAFISGCGGCAADARDAANFDMQSMSTQGLQPLPAVPSETTTRGLPELAANAKAYYRWPRMTIDPMEF